MDSFEYISVTSQAQHFVTIFFTISLLTENSKSVSYSNTLLTDRNDEETSALAYNIILNQKHKLANKNNETYLNNLLFE